MPVQKDLKTRHPIEAFGHVTATRGDIRVELLQNRLAPKVPFPHAHDFFHMLFITDGCGWHQVDFTRYSVKKNTCFIVKPGQVHHWELNPKIKGYVIEFTHESFHAGNALIEAIQNNLRNLPDYLHLSNTKQSEDLFKLVISMHNESIQRPMLYQLSLQNRLSLLLLDLARLAPNLKTELSTSDSTVENFRHLVDQNFTKHHAIEFYSENLNLNPKALTMRLKRLLKKSARDIIQERILIEAKRFLLYSNFSINDVAYKLGYDDPNYFIRFFHQHVGLTPAKFRSNQPTMRS